MTRRSESHATATGNIDDRTRQQRKSLLTRLGGIVQRLPPVALVTAKAIKPLFTVIKEGGGVFAAARTYTLPPETQRVNVDVIAAKPLKLHDMEVIHITFDHSARAGTG